MEGQQATQSSISLDQAVDQHAGAGGMFSTHIIALHDGGSYTATNHICLHSWLNNVFSVTFAFHIIWFAYT